MANMPLLAISLISLLPYVVAHGFVASVVIDGKSYEGNVPQIQSDGISKSSPIRQINTTSPVQHATNPNLICGQGAAKAALVASANPGSNVTFVWSSGNIGTPWPHNEGPLMTYMALCERVTCDQYDPTNATWFKIDEAGKKSDGNWTQEDIHEGKSYSITLPPKIPAGDYLIRHEIIALHAAIALYGAEFYPSCTQVHISGNDSGTFTPTGSIPGIYHDNDPGIKVDLYTHPNAAYSFPGPAIATFQEDGSSNSTSDTSTSSSTSSTSDSSTSPSTSSTPTSTTVPSSSADSSTTSATATPTTGAQASCTANRKRRIMRKSTFLS